MSAALCLRHISQRIIRYTASRLRSDRVHSASHNLLVCSAPGVAESTLQSTSRLRTAFKVRYIHSQKLPFKCIDVSADAERITTSQNFHVYPLHAPTPHSENEELQVGDPSTYIGRPKVSTARSQTYKHGGL